MEEIKRALQLNKEGKQGTDRPPAGTRRHLGEVWKPGDDGPIEARVGEADLPLEGEGQLPTASQESAAGRTQVRLGYSCSAAGECAEEAIFCCHTENSHHLKS